MAEDNHIQAISFDTEPNRLGTYDVYAQCEGGQGVYYTSPMVPALETIEAYFNGTRDVYDERCVMSGSSDAAAYPHVAELMVHYSDVLALYQDEATAQTIVSTQRIDYAAICTTTPEPVSQAVRIITDKSLEQNVTMKAALKAAEERCLGELSPPQVTTVAAIPASLIER